MRHWRIFHGVVANYRLLPVVLVGPVTYALPPAEAAIGATLPTGLIAPWTEVTAALLLAHSRLRWPSICCAAAGTSIAVVSRAPQAAFAMDPGDSQCALVLLLVVANEAPSGRPDGWTVVNGLLAGCALFVVLQSLNALWAIIPALRRPGRPGVPWRIRYDKCDGVADAPMGRRDPAGRDHSGAGEADRRAS